jgi:hypothetical protein
MKDLDCAHCWIFFEPTTVRELRNTDIFCRCPEIRELGAVTGTVCVNRELSIPKRLSVPVLIRLVQKIVRLNS